MTAYLIVNFGGPRSLSEIEPFLSALLTDRDVVRTKLPAPLQDYLFRRVARKRAKKLVDDYATIGGGSPTYAYTESVADALRSLLGGPLLTFYRYLPMTHAPTLEALEKLEAEEIRVFPMFPQFTYATTGSVARFLSTHLSPRTARKLKWVKSYPSHPAFITAVQKMVSRCLVSHQLEESKTFFLFSAHGLPKSFVEQGDIYDYECRLSYTQVMKGFPQGESVLAYQSTFGPGEWLRPYTQEVCEQIEKYRKGREAVLFIPISFTSDHIETLFEIEQLYLPTIREQGLTPYRLDALNTEPDWIRAIATILETSAPTTTEMLIRTR